MTEKCFQRLARYQRYWTRSLVISVVKYIDHETVYNVLYTTASKTHKKFFVELENALPTYTTALSPLILHMMFHSEISDRAHVYVGGKLVIVIATRLFIIMTMCEAAHSRRNVDHALWRSFVAKTFNSEKYSIKKIFNRHENNGLKLLNDTKPTHVAIDY